MKDLIKENLAIVAAIILPVILVIVFTVSLMISRVAVEDPKYDFFVSTGSYGTENSKFNFSVIDQRLVVRYRGSQTNSHTTIYTPRLWRVNVKSGSAEEISPIWLIFIGFLILGAGLLFAKLSYKINNKAIVAV